MRVIFLDMDGVLCTYRAHEAQGIQKMPGHHGFMDALDREGVDLLNKITKLYPDTVYVLSSTWRNFHSKEEMEEWLRRYGWTGRCHDDWRTVRLNGPRGLEIEEWLNRHLTEWETYVILDDNSDMLENQKANFVQTDEWDGILTKHFNRIKQVLA